MTVEVIVRSPRLAQLTSLLSGARRVELNQVMGEAVREETRDHLRTLAGERHDTAQRLGATPSGHLAEASRAVENAPVTADESGASFTIRHPGMIRAFRDVHIAKRTAQALAIPLHRLAYARRPAQIWDQYNLFIRGGRILMPQGKGQPPLALYALVRSVTQRQDRSLLPSDEEWSQAAAGAAAELISSVPD